jgi:hypothetical protein
MTKPFVKCLEDLLKMSPLEYRSKFNNGAGSLTDVSKANKSVALSLSKCLQICLPAIVVAGLIFIFPFYSPLCNGSIDCVYYRLRFYKCQ